MGGKHVQRAGLEWRQHARERGREAAEAETSLQRQQLRQPRRQHRRRNERKIVRIEPCLSRGEAHARENAKLAEYLGRRDSTATIERAVHQHRHAEPLQHQRYERQQMRMTAHATVCGEHHRASAARRSAQAAATLLERGGVTQQLGQRDRLLLEQRQHGTQLNLSDARIEDRRHQLVRLALIEVAAAAGFSGKQL